MTSFGIEPATYTTNSTGTILPRHMTAQLAEFIANHETLTDLLM